MKKASDFFLAVIGILLISACNMPDRANKTGSPTTSFDQKVAMTLTAIRQTTLQAPSPTATLVSPTLTEPPTATFTAINTIVASPTFTPTQTKVPTSTKAPTQTPIPKPGTIEGGISGYPYGAVPRLAIVAFEQDPPYNYSYWITAPGSGYYSMTSTYLLPGKYLVVAYDPDGNRGGCPDIVTVKSEESVTCDITDWTGSFPAMPGNVPFP